MRKGIVDGRWRQKGVWGRMGGMGVTRERREWQVDVIQRRRKKMEGMGEVVLP